ncbi:MAG: helix-turn-helix transcriptional regulator [Clostridia bacterium]|nr:helix-turn-helix transcriptional regulator [Clostridia bacterium]
MYTPSGNITKRKDRPRWAVVIKYEGETVYTCNGKRFLSDANHLIVLPRGCTYEWKCTKSGHCAIIEIESDATYLEPIPFSVKNSEKIQKAFQALEHKRNLKAPTVELESIRDTYSIILMLLQAEHYLPSEKRLRIEPAIEYISKNYNKPITNDELASLTGMSTVSFRKIFTQTTGISPIAYHHQLRIEKAKEMLKSDYGTLSDLAQSLGYAGLYDFSRDFKNHTGVAPSKY